MWEAGFKMNNSTSYDVCFERFINTMADLITKYADQINLDELPDIEMPKAETMKVSASFFVSMGKCSGRWFCSEKIRNISVFFGIKRLYP